MTAPDTVSSVPSRTITFKITNRGALPQNFKLCAVPVTSAKLNTCNGTSSRLFKPRQTTALTIVCKRRGLYEELGGVSTQAAGGMKGIIGIGGDLPGRQSKTNVLLPCAITRSSRCHVTARERTVRSMSRPIRSRSATPCRCETR